MSPHKLSMERRRYPECEVRPLPSHNIVLSLFLQALLIHVQQFNSKHSRYEWMERESVLTKTFIIVIMGFGSFFSCLPGWIESSSTLEFFSAAVEKVKPTKNRLKSHEKILECLWYLPRPIFPGVTFGKGLVLEHLSWLLYQCCWKINRSLRHLHELSWVDLSKLDSLGLKNCQVTLCFIIIYAVQTLVMLLFHINTQISDKSTEPMDWLAPLSSLPPADSIANWAFTLTVVQMPARFFNPRIYGPFCNKLETNMHAFRPTLLVYGESTHSHTLIYCRSQRPKSQQTINIFSNSQHSSRSPYKIINQEAINSLWIWLQKRVWREAINRITITPCTKSNSFGTFLRLFLR